MSTKTQIPPHGIPKDLGTGLFGKGRRNVLGALFSNPERPMYLREIIATAGIGPGQVQRELENLLRLRLVLRSQEGRQAFYRPNPDAPIFEELRSIVFKTFGIADAIRGALEPFKRKIVWAFIFGSVASDTHVASSDIDLMVVSDRLGPSDLLEPLEQVESKLRRRVSLQVHGTKEFQDRARRADHFLQNVLSKPRIMILGDEDELAELAARKPKES
jgi:predicted nucleotidyltransferase